MREPKYIRKLPYRHPSTKPFCKFILTHLKFSLKQKSDTANYGIINEFLVSFLFLWHEHFFLFCFMELRQCTIEASPSELSFLLCMTALFWYGFLISCWNHTKTCQKFLWKSIFNTTLMVTIFFVRCCCNYQTKVIKLISKIPSFYPKLLSLGWTSSEPIWLQFIVIVAIFCNTSAQW